MPEAIRRTGTARTGEAEPGTHLPQPHISERQVPRRQMRGRVQITLICTPRTAAARRPDAGQIGGSARGYLGFGGASAGPV